MLLVISVRFLITFKDFRVSLFSSGFHYYFDFFSCFFDIYFLLLLLLAEIFSRSFPGKFLQTKVRENVGFLVQCLADKRLKLFFEVRHGPHKCLFFALFSLGFEFSQFQEFFVCQLSGNLLIENFHLGIFEFLNLLQSFNGRGN